LLATVVVLLLPGMANAGGTGSIEGEVTTDGGTPIADVWACAYPTQGEFAEFCDFTEADGLYSIANLEAGAYKVEFWPESEAPSYVGEFYDDKPYWVEADEVEVKAGLATSGIDAKLAVGATVEGRIDAASLGGPVEHGLICAKAVTDEPIDCTPTDPDGTYVLSGLPAGEYKVEFLPAANLYNLLNQWYDHKSSPQEADLLTLAAGETQTGIDGDLEQGAAVRGNVYSALSGAPLRGIVVCVLFAGEGQPKGCETTSATGGYEAFGNPTGPYQVAFSPEFKEFFGEEIVEGEDDGYPTQYYDGASSLAAGTVLSLVAPEVRAGIDARLRPSKSPPVVFPPVTVPSIVSARVTRPKRAVRCRPGFRKRKIRGKQRCVKTPKHRHGHARHHTQP
jgi:hypothetical protein